MTQSAQLSLSIAVACAASLVVVGMTPAPAQGNQGADNLMQTGRSDSAKGTLPSVQVGAKTTSGTTQGFSGPQKSGGSGLEPPALPDASLCQAYEGRPFHADCIAKVTKR